jgi:hypothetical protein
MPPQDDSAEGGTMREKAGSEQAEKQKHPAGFSLTCPMR